MQSFIGIRKTQTVEFCFLFVGLASHQNFCVKIKKVKISTHSHIGGFNSY